ncbi:hypothetical protein Tco_0189530 [Tanacetum coccineum]
MSPGRKGTPFSFFLQSFRSGHLRVADSHTGNHPKDGFTPLETIRRLLVVIGRRSYSGFEREAFEPERRGTYLPHSNEYVSSPSLAVVRPLFATIEYNGEIGAKGTLKKSCLPPRWRLLMAQIIRCLGDKTRGLDQISNKDEEATKSQPSSKEVAHSPTGHSKKKKKFGTAEDKAPSQPSISKPVDTELHKEDLQAAGDPTSLGVARRDASTDSIAKADPGKSAPNDPIPSQQGMDEGPKNYSIDHIFVGTNPSTNEESGSEEMLKKTKMEDLSQLMQDKRSAFFTPDSSPDEPIIVSDESEEEQTERHEEPVDTSVPPPPSPKSFQLQELLDHVHLLQSQKDKLDQQKEKDEAKVASLKAKPSYLDIN